MNPEESHEDHQKAGAPFLQRQFMNNTRNGTSSFFSSGLITAAFEYFECPWVTNIHLFLVLQNVFLSLLRVKQLVKNITQESAPRQCGGRRQGVCEDLVRTCSGFLC